MARSATWSPAARANERILVHTTGLVSQDIAIAHHIYQQAKTRGRGIRLPPTAA